MVDDAIVIMIENYARKRKLIESVSIKSTTDFNINQVNINTDKFTNFILNNFNLRIKKYLKDRKKTGHMLTQVSLNLIGSNKNVC